MRYLSVLLLALGMAAFRPAFTDCPAFSSHAAFTDHTIISIKGSRQGQFKGQTNSKGGRETDGWFEVAAFQFGAETPVDNKSGGPTGKRTHGTVIINKQTDAASPLLFEALNTSEILEVVIQTLDENNKVVKNITLKNAAVKAIHKDKMENITFEYADIIIHP